MKCKMCGCNHLEIRSGICRDCFDSLAKEFGDTTLRDQFAMAALNILKECCAVTFCGDGRDGVTEEYIVHDVIIKAHSKLAYQIADAMMAARKVEHK